ncbi:MAG: CDP-diacylglycerol--serine O-phosphatidyltransferase, partial [Hyphomicrobiales bacterium]|nr:CDP-diacylglycerol--serine O-phosphatidyltransferase [Hyphomicrobiales bacterium]
GMPAPAGALTVLLPIYLELLGLPRFAGEEHIVLVYTLFIAFMMVSKIPTYSGKKLGQRIPREAVLPIFVLAVLFVALLVAFTWQVLAAATIAYLGCLPLGWRAWNRLAAEKGMGLATPEGADADDVGDLGSDGS